MYSSEVALHFGATTFIRSGYCWKLSSLPFPLLRSSKEKGKNHGPVSPPPQSSAGMVLIPKLAVTVLHPTWVLGWTVWTCGQFTFSLSHRWACGPGFFETLGQKWKGSMPTLLLTQCPKGHITLVFVVGDGGKLTSTLLFPYLILICESRKPVHPQPVLSCQIL